MTKSLKKYRLLISILYPLYANFFFFTPFLHHHPSDGNSFQPENVDIHSHINVHNEEHHQHDFGHHFDDCRNHEGMYQLNTYQFISLTKSIHLNHISDLYTSNLNPPKTSFLEFRLKMAAEFPEKVQWKKHVLFAANISPPIC